MVAVVALVADTHQVWVVAFVEAFVEAESFLQFAELGTNDRERFDEQAAVGRAVMTMVGWLRFQLKKLKVQPTK